MSEAVLTLHAGGQLVSYDELKALPTPPPERRWHPVGHSCVLDTVKDTLKSAGYAVQAEKLAVARGGQRFFGTLDLTAPLAPGVTLAVGIRNSTDKSFPLGFCAGSRVFVCDNLAFRSELLVKKKHTRFGAMRFANQIGTAVQSLASFRDAEGARIRRMMVTEIGRDRAYALILQAFEKAIIASTSIAGVLKEWKEPSHDFGEGDTLWKLLNCFTTVLSPRAITSPAQYAGQTMRLSALLCADAGVAHAA